MSEYNYTKTPVDVGRLTEEIQTSSIITALDHITVLGSALDVFFKADLSGAEQTTLNTIVTNHTGTPLSQNSIQLVSVEIANPFASKTININGVVKKLYKREHGIQQALTQGANTILFTIPYPWVKIIGVEIMYGEKLDTVDLMILDSTTGTYSGVPNLKLNQFGFTVNVAIDEYEEESAYDADLYLGMQIKIVYNSQSAKTVGINFNLNEMKD